MAKLTKEDFISSLKEMNLLEIKELVDAMKEEFGVDPSAVSQWGELVPEGRAMRLQEASGGELQYDPKVYDEYRKAKRAGRLNNENHP